MDGGATTLWRQRVPATCLRVNRISATANDSSQTGPAANIAIESQTPNADWRTPAPFESRRTRRMNKSILNFRTVFLLFFYFLFFFSGEWVRPAGGRPMIAICKWSGHSKKKKKKKKKMMMMMKKKKKEEANREINTRLDFKSGGPVASWPTRTSKRKSKALKIFSFLPFFSFW